MENASFLGGYFEGAVVSDAMVITDMRTSVVREIRAGLRPEFLRITEKAMQRLRQRVNYGSWARRRRVYIELPRACAYRFESGQTHG